MTTEFVSIVNQSNGTIRNVCPKKNAADVAETIYYIYVVDTDNKLVGVISLRDLIINDEDNDDCRYFE